MKPKIFLYESMHAAGMDLLQAHGEVIVATRHDEKTLIDEAQGAQAIVVRVKGLVSRAVMDALPQLKVIGRHGVGLDNVDVEYALQKGISIVYTPEAPSNSTAEHAIALLLSLSRSVCRFHEAFKAGTWDTRGEIVARELRGKTLGIVGMGRIGRRVAEMASLGIRMQVLYHDVRRDAEAEARYSITFVERLESLLGQCDYLTLHVPLGETTRHLLNRERFAHIKPGACLINTSRGGVVDSEALLEALQSGRLAGAALDVFDPEPVAPDHPLLHLPQVVVTPHVAGMSEESMVKMSLVAEDIIAVLEGKTPRYPYRPAGAI